jgi:Non-repetitive/WGA-negative nucleoporin C-terminal
MCSFEGRQQTTTTSLPEREGANIMTSTPLKSSRTAETTHIREGPWSIDLLPSPLASSSSAPIVVGSLHPPWYCAVTKEARENEMAGLQPYRITVIYHKEYPSHSPRHAALSPSRILPHCEWTLTQHLLEGVPPLVQMLQQPNTEVCYLYLCHSMTCVFYLYKIAPPTQQMSTLQPLLLPPSQSILIERNLDSSQQPPQFTITAFLASWRDTTPLLILGTSDGSLYQVWQSHIPLSLRVVPMRPSSSSSNKFSAFSRLWSKLQYTEPPTPVVALVGLADGHALASVSETGLISIWSSSSSAINDAMFHLAQQQSLSEFVRETLGTDLLQVLAVTTSSTTQQLHAIVLTHHRYTEETRLYWIVAAMSSNGDTVTMLQPFHAALWIDRCIDPPNVNIPDFAAAPDTGLVYLWFSERGDDPPTILLVSDGARLVAERDWPGLYEMLPRTAVPEAHSSLMVWDTGGFPSRVQCTLPPSSQDRSMTADASQIEKGTTHLLSLFRAYYRRPGTVRLPPSLTSNLTDLMDATVLATAQHLLRTETTNALDIHVSYIHFLQQSGLYRQCSFVCKWNLMSVGQQATVLSKLHGLSTNAVWGKDQIVEAWRRDSAELDVFLLAQYDPNGRESKEWSTDQHQAGMAGWLELLSSATTFREERAAVLYDLAPNPPPLVRHVADVPVWTTRPLLHNLLKAWIQDFAQPGGVASMDQIEYVIELYLLSCSDTFASCPNTSTKAAYIAAQKLTVEAIRQRHGRSEDEYLWEICLAHRSFQSLCQMAHDHERRRDHSTFSLEAALAKLGKDEDVETGLSFPSYVLKWQLKHGYLGHLFQFGKLCPTELNALINQEETLKPLRWIHYVRRGDFNAATESLLHAALQSTIPFAEAKTSFCLASMANFIVEEESVTLRDVARKRRLAISNKMELMDVQRELLGDDVVQRDTIRLWSSERLLDLALQKAEEQSELSDRVNALFLGLLVCTTLKSDAVDGALAIWHKAICLDADVWKECVSLEIDLSSPSLCERLGDQTVFGALLQQLESGGDWESVAYPAIAEDLAARYGKNYPQLLQPGMQRLLHSVVSFLNGASENAMQ